MVEPTYSKAFSSFYGEDFRRTDIDNFKSQADEVLSIMDEIASKRAEVVERTPFDNYDDNIALQVIDERLKEIYQVIQNNPSLTREYVEDALLPIQDILESIDEKVNTLLIIT